MEKWETTWADNNKIYYEYKLTASFDTRFGIIHVDWYGSDVPKSILPIHQYKKSNVFDVIPE